MNTRDKIRKLEPQIVAASISPALDQVFRKIKAESDLTVPEVEALLYAIECDNPSLLNILCSIHAVLDIGSQADIDSLATSIKQWAQSQNINLEY